MFAVLIGAIIFRSTQSSGAGAKEPDGAAREFITSLYSADFAGIINTLHPDEVQSWMPILDHYTSGHGAGAGGGAAGDAGSGGGAAGGAAGDALEVLRSLFTIDIDGGLDGTDLTTSVTYLDNSRRIARISLERARIKVTTNPTHRLAQDSALISGLPHETTAVNFAKHAGQTATIDIAKMGDVHDVTVTGDLAVLPSQDTFATSFELIAIKHNSRWFISPGYSLTKSLIADSGDAQGAYGHHRDVLAAKTAGAASQENLVKELVKALPQLNVQSAMTLVDPVVYPYLYDYGAVTSRELRNRARSDMGPGAELVDIAITTHKDGDRHIAALKSFTLSDEFRGTTTLDMATQCITQEYAGTKDEQCFGAALAAELGVTETAWLDASPDHIGFVVVKRKGRWYVDPIATYGYLLKQMDQIEDKLGVSPDLAPLGLAPWAGAQPIWTITPLISTASQVEVQAENGLVTFAADLTNFAQITTTPPQSAAAGGAGAAGAEAGQAAGAAAGAGAAGAAGVYGYIALLEVTSASGLDHPLYRGTTSPETALLYQEQRDGGEAGATRVWKPSDEMQIVSYPHVVFDHDDKATFNLKEIQVVEVTSETVSAKFNNVGDPIVVVINTAEDGAVTVEGDGLTRTQHISQHKPLTWIEGSVQISDVGTALEPYGTYVFWGSAGDTITFHPEP